MLDEVNMAGAVRDTNIHSKTPLLWLVGKGTDLLKSSPAENNDRCFNTGKIKWMREQTA